MRICSWMGATRPFDPTERYSTSWLLPTLALAIVRLLFGLFALTTLIFLLVYRDETHTATSAGRSFSYFTVLTYWGLAFYFLVAAVHSFTYRFSRSRTSLLYKFPQVLQGMHVVYFATIVTYPIIVTIVFWAILYKGPFFPQIVNRYSNISQHALNSFFALFEILLSRGPPPRWPVLIPLVLILALYLGLAYLTHATQHFYVYGFLDPATGHGKVAGYIIGILVAEIVVFVIVKTVIWLRIKITEGGSVHDDISRAKGSKADAVEMEVLDTLLHNSDPRSSLESTASVIFEDEEQARPRPS